MNQAISETLDTIAIYYPSVNLDNVRINLRQHLNTCSFFIKSNDENKVALFRKDSIREHQLTIYVDDWANLLRRLVREIDVHKVLSI